MFEAPHFTAKDGDAWFIRNLSYLVSGTIVEHDPVIAMIERSGIRPRSIYEHGCSNGWRLEELRKRLGAECFGYDISPLAIKCGQAMYPELCLESSPAQQVELVICSFVFHWLSRGELFSQAGGLNSLVARGGYLLLADFAPDMPVRVPYKHREGLYTWKLPDAYSRLFLATGLYQEISQLVFDHDSREEDIWRNILPGRRAMCVLLRKEGAYEECA